MYHICIVLLYIYICILCIYILYIYIIYIVYICIYIYSFICTWICLHLVFSSAQTLDQADHGKGQLHRTYQGHDVGRTWKKHLHLSNFVEKKNNFPGGCTYTSKYVHLYFGEKKPLFCSYGISYHKRKQQWFDEISRWNWDAYVLAS